MWYFAWILGAGLASTVAILNGTLSAAIGLGLLTRRQRRT